MTYLLISKNPDTQYTYLKDFIFSSTGTEIKDDIRETADIHILDRRKENSIGIEDVKKFIQEMKFKPFQNGKQIALIYSSEKLTAQAQNSLLKTLEESPDNTIYILCVDNEKHLLPTIVSRSKSVYVKQEKNNPQFERPTILDQDLVEQFKIIEDISKEKDSCLDLLFELEGYLKMEFDLEIKNGNIESSRVTLDKLKAIQDTRNKINANCNKKLVLEALFLYLNA